MGICSWYNNVKVKIEEIEIEYYILKEWILRYVNISVKNEEKLHTHTKMYMNRKKAEKGYISSYL